MKTAALRNKRAGKVPPRSVADIGMLPVGLPRAKLKDLPLLDLCQSPLLVILSESQISRLWVVHNGGEL